MMQDGKLRRRACLEQVLMMIYFNSMEWVDITPHNTIIQNLLDGEKMDE